PSTCSSTPNAATSSVALAMSRKAWESSERTVLWAKRLGTTSRAPRKASCSRETPIAVGTGNRSCSQNSVLSGLRMVNRSQNRHQIDVGVLRRPEGARFKIEPPPVQRQRAFVHPGFDPGVSHQVV